MLCRLLLGLVLQACRREEGLEEDGCTLFICLFVLLWVALILFDSPSQQSQEFRTSFRRVSAEAFFLCDWVYLTGASIPQVASAEASCICYTIDAVLRGGGRM